MRICPRIYVKPREVKQHDRNDVMAKSKQEALQQELAFNLLQYNNGTPASLDATVETGRICKLVFLTSYPLGHYWLSPVLLEALLSLSEVNPSLSAEFLSCVLLLSVCSVKAWNLVSRSILFKKYPDASSLLLKIITTNNPYWRHWPQEEQEKVSSACMSLSDFDLYVGEGCVPTSTPISIALKSLQANSPPPATVEEYRLISDFKKSLVCRIPAKIWGSIAPSDLFFVFQASADAKIPKECFLPHLSRRFVIRPRELREPFHDLRADGLGSPEEIFCNLLGRNVAKSGETLTQPVGHLLAAKDPLDEREAYDVAKRSGDEESLKALQNAAQRWMKLNRLDLVSAAYLAKPKLLSRIVDSSDNIRAIIQELPLSLYSPVDETIDRALFRLLRQVPEMAVITSIYYVHDQNGSTVLKKAALIYPFITLRRAKCMCAAGQTVLGGLSDSSSKYRSCSLGVIETLLSVFLVLPSFPNPEIEQFCVSVLEFVIDEDRLKHGIPEFLSPICVSLFKLLGRYELRECRATLIEILSDLAKAKSSSNIVTGAAHELKATLLGKR